MKARQSAKVRRGQAVAERSRAVFPRVGWREFIVHCIRGMVAGVRLKCGALGADVPRALWVTWGRRAGLRRPQMSAAVSCQQSGARRRQRVASDPGHTDRQRLAARRVAPRTRGLLSTLVVIICTRCINEPLHFVRERVDGDGQRVFSSGVACRQVSCTGTRHEASVRSQARAVTATSCDSP